MPERLARIAEICALRGRSRATTYADIEAGLLTRGVKLGARAVGWPIGEIEALNAARIAGKSDEQIRALVKDLEAKRHLQAA